MHYSFKTEKADRYGFRFFVLWSSQQGGIRHPRDKCETDVEVFVSMRANERQVSPPRTARRSMV
ncbi:MAG: hypothetical protein WBP25_03885 [Giesbergeria sp.]